MKCNEAQNVCDKSQYKESSLWERIKLTIHLLYCKTCRSYSFKNKKLTRVIQKAKIETLPKEDKKHLKEVLEKETT